MPVLFEEDTPENLIHFIHPDVLVKGGDWQKDEIVGSDFVDEYGGEVKTVPYLKGFSTTEIIAKGKITPLANCLAGLKISDQLSY